MLNCLVIAGLALAPHQTGDVVTAPTPRFEIRLVTGETFRALPTDWSEQSVTCIDADGRRRTLSQTDIVSINGRSTEPSPARALADAVVIHTIRSERLIGRIVAGDERRISIDTSVGRYDIALIEVIALMPVTSPTEVERVSLRPQRPGDTIQAELPSANARRRSATLSDLVLLRNGDATTGLIDRVDETGVSIQTGRRRATLAWNSIRQVSLSGAVAPRQSGPAMLVEFTDGDRLFADSLRWNDTTLRVSRGSEAGPTVSDDQLREIRIVNGRWQPLSQWPVAKYEFKPFLDRRWPMQIDRNVIGQPLRVGDAILEQGVGLHSGATVQWTLSGQFDRLDCDLTIDESGNELSSVDVVFKADGRGVATLVDLQRDSGLRHVSIDLSAVNTLEVQIDYGQNGDVMDRVNIINAGLVRKAR